MKILHPQLSDFGLNANQIAIYLAALEAGDCSVGTLEQRSGLHRQLIYNAAHALQDLGLMSVEKKGGRRRFVAAPASAFEHLAFQRYQQAKALSENLELAQKQAGFSGETRTFSGRDEIQSYYLGSVARQAIGSRVDVLGVESERFFALFPPESEKYQLFEGERIKRKIRWRLILFGGAENEVRLNKGRKYLSCRLLKDKIVAPMDVMVWKDHVGFLIYAKEPLVIDIPGAEPASGFRTYLSLLWSRGIDLTPRLL